MTTTIQQRDNTVDAVILEVRTKEHLARQHDFDVRRIAAAARAKQSLSGHEVISRAKKRT